MNPYPAYRSTCSSVYLLSLMLLVSFPGCSLRHAPYKIASPAPYRIRQGDTLHTIGLRYGISGKLLQEANNIDDPRRLQIGQIIQVPNRPEVRPATDPARASLLSFAAATNPSNTGHVVERPALNKVSLSPVQEYVGRMPVPVRNARISSSFGWRASRFHEGLDLAVKESSQIHAAHDGEVIFVSESFSGYGRIIVLKGNNILTVYAHNRRNRVSKGDTVKQGEWIADVGHTGMATGSHLHFETRVRTISGTYAAVNPMTFLVPKTKFAAVASVDGDS